jgi:hypothetical protein
MRKMTVSATAEHTEAVADKKTVPKIIKTK